MITKYASECFLRGINLIDKLLAEQIYENSQFNVTLEDDAFLTRRENLIQLSEALKRVTIYSEEK